MDNGSPWGDTTGTWTALELWLMRHGIRVGHSRPYHPQTQGKDERFHRTLADGWAYARFYTSETERRAAMPGWLHFYNHHRIHSAIGAPPASRINNLSGHHN